jgi:integrase
MRLTAKGIDRLSTPTGGKRKKYYDDDVKALYLVISPKGGKGWFVHLKLPSGKYTDVKLGDYAQLTPKQARDEANEKLLATRRGTDVVKEKRKDASGTLQGFIDSKYKSHVLQTHKDATNTLRVLQEAFSEFSSTLLVDIDVSAVEGWRLKRLKQKTISGTHVLPQTINRQTALLRAALGKARVLGIIDKNPLDDLKLLKVEQQPVEFLSGKQVEQLMSALSLRDDKKLDERKLYNIWLEGRGETPLVDPDVDLQTSITDYLTPLVILILHSGLRFGEAIGMRWSDISEDNVLTVRATKTSSFRYVPLSLDVDIALTHWRRLHGVTLDRYGCSKKDPLRDTVFITMDRGGPPRPLKSVKTSWGNVRKNLPFECDFKTLRRTFGSSLMQKGSDVYTVSKLLGHSNIATTQRWYLNLGMDEYKQAVALLNSVDF